MRASLLAIVLVLTACSIGAPTRPAGRMPDNNELPTGDQGTPRKVGKPYKVAGKWYYPKEDPTYDEVGYASWYGKDFHGKLTANGEIYNMNALTAAHKTLPMPTFVKVTNLENNRSIVLRVNDRGPFVDGRLIDVSRRGAQLLGFQKQGITRVRIQASDEKGRVASRKSRPPQTAGNAPSSGQHYVHIGSYGVRDNADVQVRKLKSAGHKARVQRAEIDGRILWRVRIGPFSIRSKAEDRLDRVVADGFYEARILSESK